MDTFLYISREGWNKLCFIIIPLLTGVIFWLNLEFLTPRHYVSFGDILFPFNPTSNIKNLLSMWNPGGLGSAVPIPADLPACFFIYLLHVFSIPLWILNRIWLVLPVASLGWGFIYLYQSIFPKEHNMVSCLLSSLFVMLPSDGILTPLWMMALSGFSFCFGTLIRGFYGLISPLSGALFFAFGTTFMLANPRILYLAVLVYGFYVLYTIAINRKTLTLGSYYFLATLLPLILIANSFWLVPLSIYTLKGMSALHDSMANQAYGEEVHRNYLMQYRNFSNPLWISRLMISGHFAGKTYIEQWFVYPLTFLIPLSTFAGFLFNWRNKRLTPVKWVTLIFFFFAIAMHFDLTSQLYLFLCNHVYGFAILDSPRIWMQALTIFYGLFIAITISKIFTLIKTQLCNYRVVKFKISRFFEIVIAFFFALLFLFVSGGAIVTDRTPKEWVWGKSIYGTHVPMIKIPNEYTQFDVYLRNNLKPWERILNLPVIPSGYAAYQWWHERTIPEILYLLDPFRSILFRPEQIPNCGEFLANLEHNQPKAYTIILSMAIGYIVFHKDYYKIADHPIPQPINTEGLFQAINSNNTYFQKVMENQNLILYKVVKNSPTPLFMPDFLNCEKYIFPLELVKSTSTEYKIKIPDHSSFQLVLSQSFHPLWEATLNDKKLEHLVYDASNLSLNSWNVPAGEDGIISIYFPLQNWNIVGAYTSLFFLLFFMGWFLLKLFTCMRNKT